MSAEGNVHPASYRDENGNIAPENREAWWKAMEGKSKERFVEIETLHLLKERMGQCYEKAGVNHLEECKEYVEAFLAYKKEHNF